VNLFCEYSALIKLKYTEPDTPRPFQVPGGRIGAICLGIPTLALSVFTIINSPYQAWIFGFGTNILIVGAYGIKLLIEKHLMRKKLGTATLN